MQRWLPDAPELARVCLVHGIGEHSGRYRHLAEALVEHGLAVSAFDLRGHGRSTGRRGHTLVSDAISDLDQLLAGTPRPSFLYGHSFGAVIVLSYLLQRGPVVDGVIASAAPLRNALQRQRLKVALARTAGALASPLTVRNGLDPNRLSRDPAVVEAYLADPFVHDRASLGFARQTLTALAAIAAAETFPVPLLLIHGSDDAISDVAGSRELARRWDADCSLAVYEGLYHECHNEPEQRRVISDLLAWLDARLRDRETPLR